MSAALALLTSMLIVPPVHAAKPGIEVRVRLKREMRAIQVSGFELRVSAPSAFISAANPPNGLQKATISRNTKGVWLVKWDGRTGIEKIHADNLSVRGQLLRVGPEPVPYDLEVFSNPKEGLDLIARLDLESYLAGVLPSEMPLSWPIEALKAQAVAARSFVLRTAFERRNKHFDVDSTIMDQVYKFLSSLKQNPELKDRVNKVVRETKGEILLDRKNRVLKAFYSADCGCTTEDPKFVWGKVDSFESVKDPTCGQRKTAQWNVTMSKKEVRKKLLAALELPEASNLRTIQIGGRTPSGRVAEVVAALEIDGETHNFAMNAQEFRKIMGFEKIRSSDFSLRWLGRQMKIEGSGLGHGVGLCQTGAKGLAIEGMNYREILKLYYPKAKLLTRNPV
jgi:stage II sporulation protein D